MPLFFNYCEVAFIWFLGRLFSFTIITIQLTGNHAGRPLNQLSPAQSKGKGVWGFNSLNK